MTLGGLLKNFLGEVSGGPISFPRKKWGKERAQGRPLCTPPCGVWQSVLQTANERI